MDLRTLALAGCNLGMVATAVAAKYHVSEGGSWAVEAAEQGHGRNHPEAVRPQDLDLTLRELKQQLGLALSLATL